VKSNCKIIVFDCCRSSFVVEMKRHGIGRLGGRLQAKGMEKTLGANCWWWWLNI